MIASDINHSSSPKSKIFPNMTPVSSTRKWQNVYKDRSIRSSIKLPMQNTSLLDIFEHSFTIFKKKPAYICMGTTITFEQLDKYSQQIAAYLQSVGMVKGDKVAIMMPNILQYPIISYGVLRAGMTLVNINPLYTSRELSHQLRDSGAKALFIIENFASTYQNAQDKGVINHVVLCNLGDMLGAVKGSIVNMAARYVKKIVPEYKLEDVKSFKQVLSDMSNKGYTRPKMDLSDIALLQYTGGTTGRSKGAMLSHGNLVSNILQINCFMDSAFYSDENIAPEAELILTALPLYHVLSFMVSLMYGSYHGSTCLLIPDPRDINGVIKEIKKYEPTVIPGVNTLFNAFIRNPEFAKLNFSRLKLAISGGASTLPTVAKKWQVITGVPITEGYGLSETSPLVSVNPMNMGKFTGTIGVPVPSTDVILVDDSDNEVAHGERGEICIKGPQVMVGYYNRPKETLDGYTSSGYFKTGDIGVMDDKGFFKVVDRKKDMILVSGFNVYPNEIEEVMSEHPSVIECGAIGVPSETRGEDPKLFVVRTDNITEQDLLAYAKENLTGYKRPRSIQFVDELPKSNIGKILRKDLRALEGI